MAIVDSTKTSGLFPQGLADQIIAEMPKQSAALALFQKRTMTARTEDQPVLAALPSAGFTEGDLGHAPTTLAEWKNKRLKSEDLKTSIIVPENVLRDSKFPLWDEIKPLAVEAMALALDRAVLFGVGAPASFGGGVVPLAIAAGNTFTRGTNAQNKGGLYRDIVETMRGPLADGYAINGFAASDLFELDMMSATDTQGQPLMVLNSDGSNLLRRNLAFSTSSIWPQGAQQPELIAGDFKKGIIGVRQEIEYKFVTEGVVSDPVTGTIIYNLPQQGAVEMILTARYAFVMANPATPAQPDAADDAARCPFGVLLSPAA